MHGTMSLKKCTLLFENLTSFYLFIIGLKVIAEPDHTQ